MSRFNYLALEPKDPIFGIKARYNQDARYEKKVDLIIGTMVDTDGGPPPVWEIVKQVENDLLQHEKTKNYLPITGDSEFIALTKSLIFGRDYPDTIYGAQTVGGTAALRILIDWLVQEWNTPFAISDPSWPNHAQILRACGAKIQYYDYWQKHPVPYASIREQISQLQPNTVLLLQPACHNPTGVDFAQEEWKDLSNLCLEKQLIPFFDFAYQGLAKGISEDAFPIRHFVKEGHEVFVAYSFAKNFSLYGERAGALFVVAQSTESLPRIEGQIASRIRTAYSNPPLHGSSIIKRILTNTAYQQLHEKELSTHRKRIRSTRHLLATQLQKHHIFPRTDYIESGNGFFTLLPLTQEQIERLRKEYAIYMTDEGRINILGVHAKNLGYLIECMKSVV